MNQGQSHNPRDSALLRQYEQDGYCIQTNVFSDKQCAELIAAACGLNNFRQGIARPAMMPHRESKAFLQALKNPTIVSTIETMVGGRPVGLQTEFFYCPPKTRGFSSHQDNFFVEAPPGQFASAWCALTDVAPYNGGLIVYPGTHREGDLPVRKVSLAADQTQDPNANNEETIVPPRYAPVSTSVPKGAVLYIHGNLVHGSNVNHSDQCRYVLLMTYIRQGAPFRPGNYAKRKPVNVYD